MSPDPQFPGREPDPRFDPHAPTLQRPAASRPAGWSAPLTPTSRHGSTALSIAATIAVGSVVSLTLGIYARVHEPTFFAVNVAGFSSPTSVKAWLTTVAALLALAQLASASVLYRGIRGRPVRWIGAAHVWTGRAAILVTVPVAVHCLYALGLSGATPRALAHSLFGCLLYGAFATKMLLLTRKSLPGWTIPVAGGVLFALLILVWATSALWFFQTTGLTL